LYEERSALECASKFELLKYLNLGLQMYERVTGEVSAGMRLIQPIALAWLSPTPAKSISEMPTGESQGPVEA
jgi:hypothetical protein